MAPTKAPTAGTIVLTTSSDLDEHRVPRLRQHGARGGGIELGIEGVVLTMLDERTNLAQQVMAELKRFFGDKLCSTTIPRNIRLAEAPSHGRPALLYDPRSKGAESYIRLAKEIIAHYLPATDQVPAAEMDKTA